MFSKALSRLFKRRLIRLITHGGLGLFFYYLMKKCQLLNSQGRAKRRQALQAFQAEKEYDVNELAAHLQKQYASRSSGIQQPAGGQQESQEQQLQNQSESNNSSNLQFENSGRFFVRGNLISDNPLLSNDGNHQRMLFTRTVTHYKTAKFDGEKKVLTFQKEYKSTKSESVNSAQLAPLDILSSFPHQSQQEFNNNYAKQTQKPQSAVGQSEPQAKLLVFNIKEANKEGLIKQINTSEESFFSDGYNFAGVSENTEVRIGLEKKEQGIRNGETVTLYGRVSYDRENRIIRMDNPTHILPSKEEYVNHIQSNHLTGFGVYLFKALIIVEIALFLKSIYNPFQPTISIRPA